MVAAAAVDTTTLLPGTGLNSTLVERALDALLKHHEKQVEKEESSKNKKTSLLGNDRPVQVQLTLFRIPGKSSNCPIRISIPHPLYQVHRGDGDNDMDDTQEQEEAEICFIVKEESKTYVQEMVEKFPQYMGCIKKVLGLQSLRKKHAQYEQQRELLHKYNMFLVDDRILPMVGKALGKHFYKSKRLPIPIKVTRQESLPYMIQKTLKSTFMTINQGTCITIRAGHTGMDSKKIIKNIMAISNNAIPKIPHKWANIQLISIKTPDSMSLPVYNKTPEALLELAKLAGITETEEDDGQEEGKEAVAKAKADKKRKNVVGDMKSPLVRALKKQKQIDEDKKKDEKTKESKEKKEKKQHKDEEMNKKDKKAKNDKEVEEPSAASGGDDKHHKKKKQRKSTEADEQLVVEEQTATKKKSKQSDNEDNKKEETKLKDDDEGDDDSNKKEFKAASKFKGSKKGYVFKMGKKGLGYYVDVKPTVDKMAMDALRRSAGGGGGSRRGGVKHNKKNKYKGTRRF